MSTKSEKLVSIVTNGNMNATILSSTVNVMKDVNCAIQAVFTGTAPTGTFHLLGSNDDTTYTAVGGADVAITASGTILWNVTEIGFAYLKVQYERTSGTGTLNVTIFLKEIY